MPTRFLSVVAAAAVAFVMVISGQAASAAEPGVSPKEAMEKLVAGNARFVELAVSSGKPNAEKRAATSASQHPIAAIVGCADSRTAPELVFDQNIGDLFVVRTAGNLVDDFALGSLEYAVEHLGVRLIVVLGHSGCGAVGAAVAGEDAPGHVGNLVRAIRPAVNAVGKGPGDILEKAIDENAVRVAAAIRENAKFGDAASQVTVVAGHQDLATGKVTWLK